MKPETTGSYQERLLRVLVHIQNNLDEPLSLEHLASLAYFSPYHFHRIFTGMVGESLHTHIRRLRLERAALRLKSSDDPIMDLALDAGYESHESFTRAFRGLFGVSPSEFRDARRSLSFPPAPSGVHYVAAGAPVRFESCHTGGDMMEVHVETIDPLRVGFIRHVGPYSEVGKTWGRLFAWAGRRGYYPPRTRFLGLVHDDPEITPPDRVRYDACFVADDRFVPQGELGVQEIAGGEYAVTVHKGPYDRLGETYARLCGEWAPSHTREIRSAPAYEIYLNDPRRSRPEELLTEIHVALEPAGR